MITENTENYLLYWRNRRKISLNKLSARISTSSENYASPKTLNRWEKSETPLPGWAISELAKAFKISEEELLYGPREGTTIAPVHTSAAFTGLDLEIGERIINLGFTSWLASRPDEARQAVESIMPWLEAAIRRAPISTSAKQGKHLLARGHELLGALAMDRMENDTAIAEFRRALTLSEELGDINLIAAHMTELGEAHRRKGNIELGISLMENGLKKAQGAGRATKGYVLEMLAYGYTDIGNKGAFMSHIEQAIDLLSHAEEGEGAGKRDFIPFEVFEIYGKAMRDFGEPVRALGYFNQAEEALKQRPYAPRWHAVLDISTSQALFDAGQFEEGTKLAIRGISLAHSCQSPRQMNRVRKLLNTLDKGKYKGVAELVQLREVVRDIYIGNHNPIEWHPQHFM